MEGHEPALLEARNLTKHFGGGGIFAGPGARRIQAVNDVTISLSRGESLGIVGESGCGKSTLARMLVGLLSPTSGSLRYDGVDIEELASKGRRRLYRQVQFVFQDPLNSLNPRKTVRQILDSPLKRLLRMERGERRKRHEELMSLVNMRPEALEKHPHEFSGGQTQRIGIARALASEPRLVIFDEPVSALDVSIQAQVLRIVDRLKRELGLTYVFISHDLAVVQYICERIVVMYLGTIVEEGSSVQIIERPRHPYTHVLFGSIPDPDVRRATRISIEGELPDPANPPRGCPFVTRCYRAATRCRAQKPPLTEHERGHRAACFFGDDPQPPPEVPV